MHKAENECELIVFVFRSLRCLTDFVPGVQGQPIRTQESKEGIVTNYFTKFQNQTQKSISIS